MILNAKKIQQIYEQINIDIKDKNKANDDFIYLLKSSNLGDDEKIYYFMIKKDVENIIKYIKENDLSIDINKKNVNNSKMIDILGTNLLTSKFAKNIFLLFKNENLLYDVFEERLHRYITTENKKSYNAYSLNIMLSIYVSLIESKKISYQKSDIVLFIQTIKELSKNINANQNTFFKAIDLALVINEQDPTLFNKKQIHNYYINFISSLERVHNSAFKIFKKLNDKIPLNTFKDHIPINKLNIINSLVDKKNGFYEDEIRAKRFTFNFNKLKQENKKFNITKAKRSINDILLKIDKSLFEKNDFIELQSFRGDFGGVILNYIKTEKASESVNIVRDYIISIFNFDNRIKKEDVITLINSKGYSEDDIGGQKFFVDFSKLKSENPAFNIQIGKLNFNSLLNHINKILLKTNDFISTKSFKSKGYGVIVNYKKTDQASESLELTRNLISMIIKFEYKLREEEMTNIINKYGESFLLKRRLENSLPINDTPKKVNKL